jgi:hypothetical protein
MPAVAPLVLRGFGRKPRIIGRALVEAFRIVRELAAKARGAAAGVKSAAQDVKTATKDVLIIVKASLSEVNGNDIAGLEGSARGYLKDVDIVVTAKVLLSTVSNAIKEIFIRANKVSFRRLRRK